MSPATAALVLMALVYGLDVVPGGNSESCSESTFCEDISRPAPGDSNYTYEYKSCSKCRKKGIKGCFGSAGCEECLLHKAKCDVKEDNCCPIYIKNHDRILKFASTCVKSKCEITGTFNNGDENYPYNTRPEHLCIRNIGIKCPAGTECSDIDGTSTEFACIKPRKKNICDETYKPRQFTCKVERHYKFTDYSPFFCNCSPLSYCDGKTCRKCSLEGGSCTSVEDCCAYSNGPKRGRSEYVCKDSKCTLCSITGESNGRTDNCNRNGYACCDASKSCKLDKNGYGSGSCA